MSETFPTRLAAVRAARVHIWGDVPFSRRQFHGPLGTYSVDVNGIPHIVIAAQVNSDLVAIHFDQFGRFTADGVQVLPRS